VCGGEEVIVVGGGNSAGQAAVFLAHTASRVHIPVRSGGLAESMSHYLIRRIEETPAIVVRLHTEITALDGGDHLERVRWRDHQTGTSETHAIRHVFAMTGAVPNTRWLEGCVALDAHGFIVLGRYAFTLAEPIARGQLRPLRNPQAPYAADGWFPALNEEIAQSLHPKQSLAFVSVPIIVAAHPLPLLEAAMCLDEARLEELAKADGVDPGALGALMQLAAMPLLHACGRSLAPQVPLDWSYGYCPVCGAWPTLAEVRGLERTHRWRCGRCGADWGLALLRCPYCGEGNHQRLGALTAEDEEATCTVDTCLTCRGYVKTRAVLQPTPPYAIILEDLATVEWDLVALARGYRRPTSPGYALGIRLVEPSSRIRTWFGRHP
jgi:Protein involved in formate dehydrogenase formation/Pyridine nucleotide-disulphide oxidoreductase